MELDPISATLEWWSGATDESVPEISLLDRFGGLFNRSQPFDVVVTDAGEPRQGPLPADWIDLKDVIIRLYDKHGHNMKLQEVQEHLRAQHNFSASKKQYKDKFKAWGVRKYGRRQSSNPQRRRTASVSTHTTSTAAAESTTTEAPLVSPNASMRMQQGHRTLMKLMYYLESRLFSGGVLHFFGPLHHWKTPPSVNARPLTSCHPSQLNSNYSRAMVLTRNNCPKPALALFSRTSDAMEALFADHHPALTPTILDAFIENISATNPRSRSIMLKQAISIAERTLGETHPITELCSFLQVSLGNQDEVDYLLWFCDRLCKVFSDKLGTHEKVSIYLNLRHFAKLIQMERHVMAAEHSGNSLEPVFAELLARNEMPDDFQAACLCYLRRKAHLCRECKKYDEGMFFLQEAVGLALQWIPKSGLLIVGNPLAEETFRLLDEYAHHLHDVDKITEAADLHAFALELCVAVRGEHDGKTSRMVAGQAHFSEDAKLYSQKAALKIRFPEVFAEASAAEIGPAHHKLPCHNCGNGQDTQLWCEAHRQQEVLDPHDGVISGLIRHTLDILKAI